MRMRGRSGSGLAVFLLALAGGALLFIPLARWFDSLYPGAHAGFTLMGVWLILVVPGAVVLGTAAVILYPRIASHGVREATLFRWAAWTLAALLFVAAISRYRTTV